MKKLIYLPVLLFAFTFFTTGLRAETRAVTSSTQKSFSKPTTAPVKAAPEKAKSSPSPATTQVKSPSPVTSPAPAPVPPPKAEAEEAKLPEIPEETGPAFILSGYYRVRALKLWDLNLDVSNLSSEIANRRKKDIGLFYHKLRLVPTLKFNKYVTLNFEIDVFNDRPFGLQSGNILAMDTSDRQSNMILRRAWAMVLLPIGVIGFGRMPSQWGFGLSDNNGNAPDELFGDAHYGDSFDRILFATKPLGRGSDLILALVADKVVEGTYKFDDLIHPGNGANDCGSVICSRGDDVNQDSGVLLYNMGSGDHEEEENYEGPIMSGIELTYRWQKSTDSKIYSTDAFFKLNLGLLYFDIEYVRFDGESKALGFLTMDQKTQMEKLTYDKVSIDASGYSLDVGINTDQYKFNLQIGNASGDVFANPVNGADKSFTAFSFHPDYNVGMLMFEYALDEFMRDYAEHMKTEVIPILLQQGRIDQDTANELDAEVALLPTDGSVTNAYYLNPVFTYKLFDEKLKINVGYLYAKANSPRVIGPEKLWKYGHELDLGIKYAYTSNLLFGLEGGVLFPGDYFKVQDIFGNEYSPETMYGVEAKMTVLFGKNALSEE